MRAMPEPFDIAIVGAGAAGLAAAAELGRAGLRVIVLEARDRIGGRIHTVHDPASVIPIELGAEFIHGKPPSLLKIVCAQKLLACNAEGKHLRLIDGRLVDNSDLWEQIEKIMSGLERRQGPDVSFETYLEECCGGDDENRRRELARGFVEGFDAAPADRIGVAGLARAQLATEASGGFRAMRLLGGYDQVPAFLHGIAAANSVEFRLRAAVRQITWKTGEVYLRCEGPQDQKPQDIRAKGAILTLPVGVLQARPPEPGAIRFAPDIPEKLAVAARLAMGSVVKIIFQFREPFWEDERLPALAPGADSSSMAFLHGWRLAFPTWWSSYPVASSMLVGWAGGPAAQKLSGKTPEALRQAGLQSLAALTGLDTAKIESLLERCWSCDWQSDPLSRGAYSYVPVGSVQAVSDLGAPLSNTLFFAGEATDDQTFGATVPSALISGVRAARQALDSIKK